MSGKWDPDQIRVTVTGYAADTNTSRSLPISLIAENIRTVTYQKPILAIRELYQRTLKDAGKEAAKTAVKPKKQALPGIMWSGIFSKRGDANCEVYSGLLCADLDDLEPERSKTLFRQFKNDPSVVLVFTSPTATGLKVVFKVSDQKEQHAASFKAVCGYLQQVYKVDKVDPTSVNLERLCFVSHDPEVFLNSAPEPICYSVMQGFSNSVNAVMQTNRGVSEVPEKPQSLETQGGKDGAALNNNPCSALNNSTPAAVLARIADDKKVQAVVKTFETESQGKGRLYLIMFERKFEAEPGKRNSFIANNVKSQFHAMGEKALLEMAGSLYDCHKHLFNTSREKHLEETKKMIDYVSETYLTKLNDGERQIYEALDEKHREAFRIYRDLANQPDDDRRKMPVFFCSDHELAMRLSLPHDEYAWRIRKKMIEYGIVIVECPGARPEKGKKRGPATLLRWML